MIYFAYGKATNVRAESIVYPDDGRVFDRNEVVHPTVLVGKHY